MFSEAQQAAQSPPPAGQARFPLPGEQTEPLPERQQGPPPQVQPPEPERQQGLPQVQERKFLRQIRSQARGAQQGWIPELVLALPPVLVREVPPERAQPGCQAPPAQQVEPQPPEPEPGEALHFQGKVPALQGRQARLRHSEP